MFQSQRPEVPGAEAFLIFWRLEVQGSETIFEPGPERPNLPGTDGFLELSWSEVPGVEAFLRFEKLDLPGFETFFES